MDLHRDIMNLPTRIGPDCGNPFDYKLGHRDARHDAAELVLKYERYIELMEDHFGLGMTGILKRQAGLI